MSIRSALPAALALAALLGCASFRPIPMQELPFPEELQVQERDGFRVAVAVPDREQTRQIFGVDLWESGMQPVWVEIENQTDLPYSLFFSVMDSMYFSPHEVAYNSHLTFRPGSNERMDRHFDALGIEQEVAPGGRTQGFVFTNKDEGTKHVRVGLFGPRRTELFSFDLFGRPQDAGFQKARDSIHQRNHLRVWLAPIRFRGEPVWIGTITRDIGVYFTTRAWNLTTHAIDPYVDEARAYVSEDLLISQMVPRFGFVDGVGEASRESPHRNLMFAPWWTDGYRTVFELDLDPTSLEEVAFFYWDWPGFDDSEAVNEALRALAETP